VTSEPRFNGRELDRKGEEGREGKGEKRREGEWGSLSFGLKVAWPVIDFFVDKEYVVMHTARACMSLCCRAAVGVSTTLAADLLLRVDGVNCLRPSDDIGIYTLDGRHVTSNTVIVDSVPRLCFVML